MASVSDWSANEKENTYIDELTLSGESGQYINKIMCAVRAKADAIDSTVLHKAGDEGITGVKTFAPETLVSSTLGSGSASGRVVLMGGMSSGATAGAKLGLHGKSHSQAGSFFIYAGNSEAQTGLVGTADGSLQWGGQDIQTSSDERKKTLISGIPGAVLDAWETVSWGQFQFLAAVEKKGASARLHTGLVAQAVKRAFEDAGLDACAYGMLCHVVRDADEDMPAVEEWTVRYAEALAMEAACQRRRADRLEARVAALEARVNGVN